MRCITTITTVTTAASSYDLTTLEAVKAELGLTDAKNDAVLKRYIAGASAAAAQYCGRVFPLEAVEDQIWPARAGSPLSSAFEKLQLSRWPVTEILSLTDDGVAKDEDADFVVDRASGLLTRLDGSGRQCRWGSAPKVVSYKAGYGTIPADLEDAVIRMVKGRWLARGRDPNLKSQDIPGVLSQTWWIATGSESGNMSPDIADLLDNYRVPIVA